MINELQEIQEAAKDLYFLSESDFPLEPINFEETVSLETKLLELANKPSGTPIEKIGLDYFFRNMTRIDINSTDQQQTTAKAFTRLQQTLEAKLIDAQVWRVGITQIDAFIIGKLSDGSYAGLRTMWDQGASSPN